MENITTRNLISLIRAHAVEGQNPEFNALLGRVAGEIEEFPGGPEVKEEVDPAVVELEAALKGHDWYFDYSDDGRVWREGKDQEGRIKQLIKAVTPEAAAELWSKYAPKGFALPR